MKYSKYNFATNVYNSSQNVTRVRNCNGFIATNIGDTALLVNGKLLFPSATPLLLQGDSITFGGNEGETYIGYITISFAVAGSVFPVGANPLVEIIQKYYLDNETSES